MSNLYNIIPKSYYKTRKADVKLPTNRKILVLADIHCPYHSKEALWEAIRAGQGAGVDTVIILGDMMDFHRISKYPNEPGTLSFQKELEVGAQLAFAIRDSFPNCQILYIEGNHEDRIAKAIRQLLSEAEGVRPVDDEAGPPLLSVPRLLALESLDVDYIGPYGAEHWLWDSVRVHHGEVVRRRGGATASAVVSDASHCEIYGHVHRQELACRTIHGPNGQRVLWALSPGTITRIDGVVPANTSRVDWQQGLAVIERDEGGSLYPSLVPITEGVCVWRGERLAGRCRRDDLRAATGVRF